ncbi:MAG: hypothetical protein K8U57_28490 [Planctomycetes bacterium]|nr:hypothetical protein [Planctomycetota bacterium]
MGKKDQQQPDGKKLFSKHLKAFLKRHRLTQSAAAAAIGMAAPTFRARISKNEFRSDEIKALKDKIRLDLPQDGSIECGVKANQQSELLIPPTTLAQALRNAEPRRKALDLHLDRFARELASLTEIMRNGDYMIVSSSSVTPLEFDQTASPALREACVKAINAGAVLIYIRPDAEYIHDNLTRLGYDNLCSTKEAKFEVAQFRAKMVELLCARFNWEKASAQKHVAEHVLHFESHRSPFFAAGFSMSMLHTKDEFNEVIRRMTIRVPGSGRALLQSGEYDRFARRYNTWVIDVLENNVKTDPEILPPIIEALREGGLAD